MAGVALIFLRVSVVATLMVDGAAHRSLLLSFWTALLYLLPALCLSAGFLTPYSAVVCCIVQSVELAIGKTNEFHLAISILNSAILAVMGPGAYSVDARIFGRRILEETQTGTRQRLVDPKNQLGQRTLLASPDRGFRAGDPPFRGAPERYQSMIENLSQWGCYCNLQRVTLLAMAQ